MGLARNYRSEAILYDRERLRPCSLSSSGCDCASLNRMDGRRLSRNAFRNAFRTLDGYPTSRKEDTNNQCLRVAMDIIGLGTLLLFGLVFGFLALRSWRARRLWVKLLAGIPTTLLAVLCLVGLGLAVYGYSKVNRVYANPASDISVAGTSAQIARGGQF